VVLNLSAVVVTGSKARKETSHNQIRKKKLKLIKKLNRTTRMAPEVSRDKPGIGSPKKNPLKRPRKNPPVAALSFPNNKMDKNNNRIGMDRKAINLLWACFSSRETPVIGMEAKIPQLFKEKMG
jgi:hypothetical protein